MKRKEQIDISRGHLKAKASLKRTGKGGNRVKQAVP